MKFSGTTWISIFILRFYNGCLPKSNGEKEEILQLCLTLRFSPLQNTFREGFAVLFEEHLINLKMYQMTVEMSRLSAYMTFCLRAGRSCEKGSCNDLM